MSDRSPLVAALRRPRVLVGIAVAVVITLIWLLAFFAPQGHKLSTLRTEETQLHQTVAQDNAKIAQLKEESNNAPQIEARYNQLTGYVPSTAEIYTYIDTLSGAAKAASITITSISPSTPAAITGSGYMGIPVTVSTKGTYDHMLAFIHALYTLPRLTDINSISISGGGPSTNRAAVLSVVYSLTIFSGQASAGGSAAAAPSTTTTTTSASK